MLYRFLGLKFKTANTTVAGEKSKNNRRTLDWLRSLRKAAAKVGR